MNGAAANNPNEETYAPLTSSLLARKGQALPAFDSDAYSEVMTGNEFTAPLSPIFTKVKDNAPLPNVVQNQSREQRRERPQPAAPRRARRPAPKPAVRFRAVKDGPDNASVTYRMPREEFTRLRRAAKELDMSCYQIILDAIECYLDANEVEPLKNENWVDESADAADAMGDL